MGAYWARILSAPKIEHSGGDHAVVQPGAISGRRPLAESRGIISTMTPPRCRAHQEPVDFSNGRGSSCPQINTVDIVASTANCARAQRTQLSASLQVSGECDALRTKVFASASAVSFGGSLRFPNGARREYESSQNENGPTRVPRAVRCVPEIDASYSRSWKPSRLRERPVWRSLRSALASIWRIRSRVTANCFPTSSSV